MSSRYLNAETTGSISSPTPTLTSLQAEAIQAGAVYYGYDTVEHGEYLLGCEKFRDIQAQGDLSLFDSQLAEAKVFLQHTSAPDYQAYLTKELQHKVVLFTVRYEGQLVGDIIYDLHDDTDNMGKIYASDNGFYLLPDYRKGALAVALLRYAENTLKQLGVSYIFMGDKEPIGGPDLAILFKRAGYKMLSRSFVKEIDDGM